ncbi:MAG: RHS repeat-associated core domain-containing protein [Candidatus Melainabacteria bacterium]|nr:RHS repeat-associated core domain-containing protein [Candidatus Melainabacteria bacterium]
MSNRWEERDNTGTLVAKFFKVGQMNGSTKYFYQKDQLSSVREMFDNSGNSQAQYLFDPFGRMSKVQENVPSDFGFAGMYFHQRSQLNLAHYRSYSPALGRWLSRDPLDGETGNLMIYANNNPVGMKDPMGLYATHTQDGNKIEITIPLNFIGYPLPGEFINEIRSGIERYWTGKFGKYCVTMKTVLQAGGNTNNIDLRRTGFTLESAITESYSRWSLSALEFYQYLGGVGWPGAHEAGHLMGLRDNTGGIMNQFNFGASPNEKNIDDFLHGN